MPLPCPPNQIRLSQIYNEIKRETPSPTDLMSLRLLSQDAYYNSGNSIFEIPDLFSDFCGYTQISDMYIMYFDSKFNFEITHNGGNVWTTVTNPGAISGTLNKTGLSNSKNWTIIYEGVNPSSTQLLYGGTELGTIWKGVNGTNTSDMVSLCVSTNNHQVAYVTTRNECHTNLEGWLPSTIGIANTTGVAVPNIESYLFTSHNTTVGIRRRFNKIWDTPGGGATECVSICCSDDGKYIYAGRSRFGNIYKSDNFGVSFISKNTSSVIGLHVCCDSTGKYVLMREHFGANIFLSIDFGETYTEISSRLPAISRPSSGTSGTFGSRPISHSGKYMAIPGDEYISISKDYGVTWGIAPKSTNPDSNGVRIDYISVEESDLIPTSAPVTNFYANNLEPYPTIDVLFYDTSTNVPDSWLWTITPSTGVTFIGSSNTDQNPKINFPIGTYDVKLKATNVKGSNIEEKIAYIVCADEVFKPVVNFNANDITPYIDQHVFMYDLSTNSPTSWKWTIWPNGTGSFYFVSLDTVNNIEVVFTSVGSFNVRLEATNSAGTGQHAKYSYINVGEIPVIPIAEFEVKDNNINPNINETIQFIDLSDNSPNMLTWTITNDDGSGDINWLFVDGTDKHSERPYVQFTKEGYYDINLEACNTAGCDNEFKDRYINVQGGIAAIANFEGTPRTILEGESVVFTDLSGNNPTLWNWTFEGGVPATSTTPGPHTIVYNTAGAYDVTLSVENNVGGSSKYENDYITVNSPNVVVADFVADDRFPTTGNTVIFTNLSSGGSGTWTYVWKFYIWWETHWSLISNFSTTELIYVDGTNHESVNPHVQFLYYKRYKVQLDATRTVGGSDTEIKENYILPQILNTDIITYYKFNENVGAKVAEDELNNTDADIYGSIILQDDGILGTGYKFTNDVNQKVSQSNDPFFNYNFSISLWVKTTEGGILINRGNGEDWYVNFLQDNTLDNFYYIYCQDDGTVGVIVSKIDLNDAVQNWVWTESLIPGIYNHICVVFQDYDTDHISTHLYVNGNSNGSYILDVPKSNFPSLTPNQTNIGRNLGNTDQYVFDTSMDKDSTDMSSIYKDSNNNMWKIVEVDVTYDVIRFSRYGHTELMPVSADSLIWVSGGVHHTTINYTWINNPLAEGLTGNLDEIAFWDRSLGNSEAYVLYNNGSGLNYPFSVGGTNIL